MNAGSPDRRGPSLAGSLLHLRETVLERPLWAAIAFMVLVRLVLLARYGVNFEISDNLWQLLDGEVLRTDPLRSLYFLHAQPPLFNALYAASLNLPASVGPLFLQIVYGLSSIVMTVIFHFFLRRFGYGPVVAAVGAAGFSALPQILIYENMFHYAHLEATLVLCAMYFAATYLSGHRLGALVGFACCLVALALLRSLFHLAWVAVALLEIWHLGRPRPGRILPSLLVVVAAIATVTSLYVKNLVEFGVFSPSSWQGLNTVTMTLPVRAGDAGAFPAVADDFRGRLARGEFSSSASLAFAAPNFWAGWASVAKGCEAGENPAPALCSMKKSNGGDNFNNIAIIRYSKELSGDAVRAVRLYPAFYVRRVASSFMTFFGTPSWSYALPGPALQAYGKAWDRLMMFQPNRAFSPERSHDTGLVLLASRFLSASLPLCAFVLVGSIFIVIRGAAEGVGYLRGRRQAADWIFPMLVVGLFLVLPNVINGGETDRIRYSIEPVLLLSWAGGAIMLWRAFRRRTSQRRGGGLRDDFGERGRGPMASASLLLLTAAFAGPAHGQAASTQTANALSCGSLKAESSRATSTTRWTISGPSGKTTETGVLRTGPRFECVDGAILIAEFTSSAGHSLFTAYFPDGTDIAYGRQQIDRRGTRFVLPIQAKARIAPAFRAAFDYHCRLNMPADPIQPATRADCAF
jgi:hypothetical protein